MPSWFFTIPAAVTFAAIAFASAAASDDDETEIPDKFSTIDADASGELSLEEIQSIRPNTTPSEFLTYDVDGSGELSAEEFSLWAVADAETSGDDDEMYE